MSKEELLQVKLNQELKIYREINLKLWKKKHEGFNLFIFSTFIEEKKLEDIWEELRNDIALYFQSVLNNEIELWNIYVIFFIDKEIEQKDLKYKIENDHYCARKIIIDNVGNIKDDEEKIKLKISKKLFDLEIPVQTTARNIDELEREIAEVDSRLINLDQINALVKQYKD